MSFGGSRRFAGAEEEGRDGLYSRMERSADPVRM